MPKGQSQKGRGHGGQGGYGAARVRTNPGGKRSCFPWINAQIISASEAGGLQGLIATVVVHMPQMNLVNLSTAVHRLAKLTANDPKALAELKQHPALEDLLQSISAAFACLDPVEAQPQSLSNVAWSLATMRLINRPLIQVVANLAVTNIASFKPFELSTMLWALAKLGTMDVDSWVGRPVFCAAATHIMKQVQHFGFRCLATTAWAFATARQRHARLFRSIAAQMVPMVHAANCQEMANTAWAFGTADFHDDQLFTELADKAILRLEEFKPQELSNMLWGFATNGFFHEAFFTKASVVTQRMDLQAQHLANILWAFARVRPRHALTHATIANLLPSCTQQLETFKPQEVSSTALAVAKAFGQVDEEQYRGPASVPPHVLPRTMPLPAQVIEFFSAVVPWALPRLREFSAQSLANTVSAYAMMQMSGSGLLMKAIGKEVLGRYDALEATALLHLLKGFSVANPDVMEGCEVVRSLCAALAMHVGKLRPQEMQTLSRICSQLLGLRRHRDFTCEELRNCCVSLSMGEGAALSKSVLDDKLLDPTLPVKHPDFVREVALDDGPPVNGSLLDVPVPFVQQGSGPVPYLGQGGYPLNEQAGALAPMGPGELMPPVVPSVYSADNSDAALYGCPTADYGQDGLCGAEPPYVREGPGYASASISRVDRASMRGAGWTDDGWSHDNWEFGPISEVQTVQMNRWPQPAPTRTLPTQPMPKAHGGVRVRNIALDMNQVAPAPAPLPEAMVMATAARAGGPVAAVAARTYPPVVPTRGRHQPTANMIARGTPPVAIATSAEAPFGYGAPSPTAANLFEAHRGSRGYTTRVKNSFLHVEADTDSEDGDDDRDGGSSQRSSSVPSSFDRSSSDVFAVEAELYRRFEYTQQQDFSSRRAAEPWNGFERAGRAQPSGAVRHGRSPPRGGVQRGGIMADVLAHGPPHVVAGAGARVDPVVAASAPVAPLLPVPGVAHGLPIEGVPPPMPVWPST